MVPKFFFDELNLKNSSRTVAAGGPCNWQPGDEWAEIRDVRVKQGNLTASCGTASTTVRNGEDQDWWLEARSSGRFTRGPAEASAVAIVHRADGTVQSVPWPDDVQLH